MKGHGMRYIALGSLVLIASTSTSAMHIFEQKITLPGHAELKKRIDGLHLPPGFERERLVNNLTSHVTNVGDVVTGVLFEVIKWNERLDLIKMTEDEKNNIKAYMLITQRLQLIEAILRDRPDILKRIKEEKL